MKPIAHVRSQFATKFGIPRQAGLVPELRANIVFEPEFRNPDALRGIEGFSHIWLIWQFSEHVEAGWSPTVRPPRLGGNARMGVFATRSPFRPNPIGLSAVELLSVTFSPDGPVLEIGGADLMDGTPILDIKPYLPADAITEIRSGFATGAANAVAVEIPVELAALFTPQELAALRGLLAQDPRPAYQDDAARTYTVTFAGKDIDFQVAAGNVHVRAVRDAGLTEQRS